METVTSPVTQVAVVAVNSASMYGTGSLPEELMGRAKRRLPISMAAMKLSNIICVVDRLNFIFFIVDQFLDIKKSKGDPRSLQTAGPDYIYLLNYITLIFCCQVYILNS